MIPGPDFQNILGYFVSLSQLFKIFTSVKEVTFSLAFVSRSSSKFTQNVTDFDEIFRENLKRAKEEIFTF